MRMDAEFMQNSRIDLKKHLINKELASLTLYLLWSSTLSNYFSGLLSGSWSTGPLNTGALHILVPFLFSLYNKVVTYQRSHDSL